MLVTVMQVLDVTVTNALPHIQGSLSAGVDEVSWVLTSYLAANAIILPATGWLAGALGRKRLCLACTVLFTLASMLCGLAPNIETLLLAHAAGHRRRAPHAALAGHHVGDLPAPAAGHGHGGVGRGHHDGADLRPHLWRLDRRQLVVALDLPHQPAHRRRRLPRRRRRALRPLVPQEAGAHRPDRSRAPSASSRCSSSSTRASATSGSTRPSSSSSPCWRR
jgi:hypothetical protein